MTGCVPSENTDRHVEGEEPSNNPLMLYSLPLITEKVQSLSHSATVHRMDHAELEPMHEDAPQ